MNRFLITFFLLTAITDSGIGQMLPFRTYSIEKGLSEAVVNDLMQDNQGYLWIGTSYGLNRFDGVKFKNYYSEDGLLNNKVFSLYEDEEGSLWIGTGGGVNVMKADSIYTVPNLAPLVSSTVLDIFRDHRGDLWFATDGEGAWHLDPNGNLTQYSKVQGLGDDRVRSIIEDDDDVLWFATRDGLTKLKDGHFRTFTTSDGLPDNRLRDLVLDNDGSLWIATRDGLCNFKGEEFHCYTEKDGLINNGIQSISKDDAGNLWLGTEEGASYFKDGTFTNYTADEGLANNIIYATEYDREGNIWFGTFGGGISIFLGNDFKSYTVEQGLPNNVITSITEDQSGRHWIGTFGGICNIQDDKFSGLSTKDGLVDDKVYTIRAGKGDSLLIGTRWGFSIYNNGTFRNFNEQELPYRKIRAILNPKHSPGIWLGTYGEGLLHYYNGRFKHLTEENGLANNTILSLTETDDGAIWIANYGGVSRLKNGVFKNYSIQDGLPNNGVLDILKSRSGDLWFATFGGIARLRDGRFNTITADDGLPDEVCYFIEQDDRGIFWIGTNKGVIRLDYDAYNSEDENIRSRAFKLVTQNQGLVANEMNAGASFKDREGNLWFGSVGGLTKFNPDEERINEVAPTVHIENMQMSGENIPLDSDIEIGSGSHNITFEFIGISFSAPQQVLYKYRLKNSGEDWQETIQRSVRYSTLIPGNYIFEVKARNNDGRWSEHAAQLSFTVLAPFWMRWWFICIVLVLIVLIVLFVYNYYRVRKMVDIERMRVRIASDLHDDVGSALTEIALQSDFLQTMDVTEDLQESLQQIGSQSRKIVTSLDDIVWSIDARNDTVGDLTDRMQDYVNSVLPQKQINYQFEGDMQEKLKVSLKENLYLIFKEAVNNIAKHSNAERVDITLSTNGAGFEMRIKDNGKNASNVRKSGQGLRNMKMRAKRIDASVSFYYNNGFEVVVKSNK
ncbi:MAG: two-component regulator propeller domain-containing protein [Balneolaceae bacterium]|jgi:ligand-binding sensor domain-containing protein/two-component sensor histidine kinase